jgi:MFS family permease
MSTIAIDRDTEIRRTWLNYGWVIVVLAAVAMGATFPGRTHGLGMFTEGIKHDFGLEEQRGFYGMLQLWATLIGALFCLPIGWLIDRIGSRIVLTAIYVTFGASVLWMSQARDWQEWFGALILTRGLGQSALSVVSITMVAKWFKEKSLAVAMAFYSVLMAMMFACLTPLVGYALSTDWNWREVLWLMGWALCAVLAPVSLILTRNVPRRSERADAGTVNPGEERAFSARPLSALVGNDNLEGATLWQALATPAFWVFSLSVSFYALVSSGVFIFNEEIFRDNGLPRSVYYAALFLSFAIGLPSNFLSAWLSNRWGIHRVLSISMAIMMAALLALPLVREAWHAYLYAFAMALSGGVISLVFFTVWGQAFGRREVGRIQAIAQMLTVLASAVGPFLFGHCRDLMGSYVPVFMAMAPAALALSVACWVTGLPKRSW